MTYVVSGDVSGRATGNARLFRVLEVIEEGFLAPYNSFVDIRGGIREPLDLARFPTKKP